MNAGLLLPEILVAALAGFILILDLIPVSRRTLSAVAALGLVLPTLATGILWASGSTGTAFSGALVFDYFSMLFQFLFLAVAFLVIVSSFDYVVRMSEHQAEYYALILISTSGMMLLASTRELISIFIALETTSVPLYLLAGFLKGDRSIEASLKYVLLGAMSTAILLYGFAFMFGLSGSTYLSEIGPRLRDAPEGVVFLIIVFLAAGFGFKLAAAPFQFWTPDVYEGAPTPITAFLAVGSKTAGFAAVIRVFYEAIGPAISQPYSLDWSILFAVISALSMTVGNVIALAQTNIKRLLGYSSIAHAGFILVALSSLGAEGVTSTVFYLVTYAATNLAAFIAVIAISHRIESDEIADFAGMFRRSPALAIGLTLGLLSLTGIPPTAGFFAKYFAFFTAWQHGLWWLVAIAVINSAVSAYYYIRIVRLMFMREPVASSPAVRASAPVASALGLAAVVTLLLGFAPNLFFQFAQNASHSFFP